LSCLTEASEEQSFVFTRPPSGALGSLLHAPGSMRRARRRDAAGRGPRSWFPAAGAGAAWCSRDGARWRGATRCRISWSPGRPVSQTRLFHQRWWLGLAVCVRRESTQPSGSAARAADVVLLIWAFPSKRTKEDLLSGRSDRPAHWHGRDSLSRTKPPWVLRLGWQPCLLRQDVLDALYTNTPKRGFVQIPNAS